VACVTGDLTSLAERLRPGARTVPPVLPADDGGDGAELGVPRLVDGVLPIGLRAFVACCRKLARLMLRPRNVQPPPASVCDCKGNVPGVFFGGGATTGFDKGTEGTAYGKEG